VKPSVALLLLLAACAHRPPADESTTSENARTEDGPVLTLERTACFGACPVYRLSVTADGSISYEGRAHVRQLGPASGRVAPERLEQLLSELEHAGYFSFADRYTPAEPVCGRATTDSPTAITSIRFKGRAKRVEHYYGCGNAPGALAVLEQRIDEVLGAAQWTGR
jgi:hypothetical protein